MATIPVEKIELFTEGMKIVQGETVLIPEGQEKNRQFLKDEVLSEMKSLFEAVDSNNTEQIVRSSLNLANRSFAVAYATGKMSTYLQKIKDLGVDTE